MRSIAGRSYKLDGTEHVHRMTASIEPTETMIREIPYALPDESRNMRITRHLNWRINRQVNAEDRTLIERVQKGMDSRRFTQGPLSDAEVCLNRFARRTRQVLPISKLPRLPEEMT